MGILSFVPNGRNWIVTMNFEQPNHVTLNPPKQYNENSGKLLFAKELDSTGSWMMVHEKGWIGAILSTKKLIRSEVQQSSASHHKLLFEIMRNNEPIIFLKEMDFTMQDPFIIVLYINNNLYEFTWNGKELTDQYLSNQKVYYWESNHYFTNDWTEKRLTKFLNQVEKPSFELPEFILALHKRFSEEKEIDIRDYNPLNYHTNIAITQVIVNENIIRYYFYDFLNPQYYTQTIVRNKEEDDWYRFSR